MVKKRDTDFIEFVPSEALASSGELIDKEVEPAESVVPVALQASTKLEDMPPVFRELAMPKLPALAKENRARLQMQSPNKLFFYWSIGSNPFQKLNRALGSQTASYSLVLKLIDLDTDSERIHPVDTEGSLWFDVEANRRYRAEVGFYAPNRPYVRALFSNTIETPRKSPSTRVDSESDWAIPAEHFAKVLEVAGFTEDAFDVALAGDDPLSAESATHQAFEDLVDDEIDFGMIAADEIRYAMLLLASGLVLDELRWKISPSLFAILQKRAESLSAAKALAVLQERFDIDTDEIAEEEFGPAVFGASRINFPSRLKTRRTLPKYSPVSSSASANEQL